MSKMTSVSCLFTLVCLLALIAGCNDNKTSQPPTTPDSNPIQLVDVSAIIENVAPPEYVAPAGSPSAIDTLWTSGQSPLLECVFGSHEPEALYTNINDFKMNHDILSSTLRVDADGNIILGEYVDSHLVDMRDGEIMMHFTATVTSLSGPTAVPAIAQSVLGTSVDVDYLISVTIEEAPEGAVMMGMTLNDSEQTIFQWDEGMSGDDEESRLLYASLDPSDSSFVFKGVGYCQHPVSDEWPNGDRFCYAYNITSDASSDFSYRMSYFSNGTPGTTFLHTFLGGGNKDTEFALKYRMFEPADTTVCDSTWMKDQVFGPNYSEGAGLLTDYDEYLADGLMFLYSAVPNAMVPNPWAE